MAEPRHIRYGLSSILSSETPHEGWFRKGEQYELRGVLYTVLKDMPRSSFTVPARMVNAKTGKVIDRGSLKRGIMAKTLRAAKKQEQSR